MMPNLLLFLLSLATPDDGPIVLTPPASIRGRVIDGHFRAAPGVDVYMVATTRGPTSSVTLWHGRSDAEGRFVVDHAGWFAGKIGVAYGLADLIAYRAGSGLARERISLISPSPEDPVTLAMVPHPAAAVRVIGPDGGPIAMAKVTPLPKLLEQLPPEMAEAISVTTGPDGRAELLTMSADDCEVCLVKVPGFGEQRLHCAGDEDDMHVYNIQPVGIASGRVICDDLKSIPRMTLRGSTIKTIDRIIFARSQANTKTDAAGRFEIPELAEGSLGVYGDRPLPEFVQVPPTNRMRIEAGQRTEVEFRLKRGVLVKGTAREQGTHGPIAGLSLAIYGTIVKTDERGRFACYLLPGPARVFVLSLGPYVPAPDARLGFLNAVELGEIPEGVKEFELPPLELVRGVDVRGVVRDSDGRPLPGTVVEVRTLDEHPLASDRGGFQPGVRTDARGEFLLRAIGPGQPVVFIAYRGDEPSEPVMERPERLEKLTLTFKPMKGPPPPPVRVVPPPRHPKLPVK